LHPMADVQSENIGQDARIWQFVVVLPGARIGSDVNICSHCFVENDVIIGDRVTIKNGVQLWDGLRIADEVFVGPNVTFTNDRYPRSQNLDVELLSTVVEKGASIGAGAVICPGITIGAGAMVAAGAVVTRDVSAGTLVVGNPAKARDLAK
jgi:UDP-2-acetamido-3-amino-2,3-dideoxy-glucuronate N-acetyltransferase